jgi:hypothetical protein
MARSAYRETESQHRVRIRLSAEAYAELQRLAAQRGERMSQTVQALLEVELRQQTAAVRSGTL